MVSSRLDARENKGQVTVNWQIRFNVINHRLLVRHSRRRRLIVSFSFTGKKMNEMVHKIDAWQA